MFLVFKKIIMSCSSQLKWCDCKEDGIYPDFICTTITVTEFYKFYEFWEFTVV